MLNLKEITTFVKLTEIGSYSKTAKALHLSQPTISVHIKSIEQTLGITLLQSVNNRYIPTEEGYIVLHYARELLRLSDELKHTFSHQKTSPDTLNVTTTSIGTYLLPKIFELFNAKFPNTHLMMSISNSLTALNNLEQNVVDAIIVQLTEEQLKDYQKYYQVVPIATDTLYLVASAQHDLTHRASLNFHDLHNQTFVMREEGSNTARILTDYLYTNQIKTKNLVHVTQHDSVYQTIRQGVGIGLLPEFWITTNQDELTILPAPNLPVNRTSYLVTAKYNSQIRYFGELAKSIFQEHV